MIDCKAYLLLQQQNINKAIKVANTKSAKKRILVAERNRQSNRTYKSTVKTLIKKTITNCENYKKDPNTDNEKLLKESFTNFSLSVFGSFL